MYSRGFSRCIAILVGEGEVKNEEYFIFFFFFSFLARRILLMGALETIDLVVRSVMASSNNFGIRVIYGFWTRVTLCLLFGDSVEK